MYDRTSVEHNGRNFEVLNISMFFSFIVLVEPTDFQCMNTNILRSTEERMSYRFLEQNDDLTYFGTNSLKGSVDPRITVLSFAHVHVVPIVIMVEAKKKKNM